MKLAAALLAVLAMPAIARADRGSGWELRLPDKIDVAAGSATSASIVLAIDRGGQIARDPSLMIDLAVEPSPGGAPGVTVKKPRLQRGDAVDPEAESPRFAVQVRGDAAGAYTLAVRARFWLCGSRVCVPVDVRRSVSIEVAASSPSGANK